MIAILGGLGAATVFAAATLCASRSTRMIGSGSVLAWVMIVGFLIVAPWAAAEGAPEGLDGSSIAWLLVAGMGHVAGLFLAYSALRIGKVGLVAPIVSTEGAIAAVIAAIAGESIAAGVGIALGVIALGILLASASRDDDPTAAFTPAPVVAGYAVAAALCFGFGLYATARVSAELPLVWALVPARIAGLVVIALPLAATARLRLTRPALPLVLVSGVAEIVGFALFAVGSRSSVAVSAVLASQFGAVAAVAAYFLFRERLVPLQVTGIVLIVAGVSVLSLLQA